MASRSFPAGREAHLIGTRSTLSSRPRAGLNTRSPTGQGVPCHHGARVRVAQHPDQFQIRLGRTGELHPRAPVAAGRAPLRASGYGSGLRPGWQPGRTAKVAWHGWAALLSSLCKAGPRSLVAEGVPLARRKHECFRLWRVRVLLGSCGLRFHPDGATGLLVRLSPGAARCRRARGGLRPRLGGRAGWLIPSIPASEAGHGKTRPLQDA